ncbi:hypothetical protein [Comamonas sp. GB3 AK4-5]|uniref:hypothetical protein n=1 Tax=Comamonas sp. GB3 AK4-5 TaxID=3231487 RepID=UPI00351F48DB
MAHYKLQPDASQPGANTADIPFRRRMLLATLGALSAGLSACRPSEGSSNIWKIFSMNATKKQAEFAYFDVTLISYLDYAIFDVYINKKDIGVASAFGGGGLITGIPMKLGEQHIEWCDAGTGENFQAIKSPNFILHAPQSPLSRCSHLSR